MSTITAPRTMSIDAMRVRALDVPATSPRGAAPAAVNAPGGLGDPVSDPGRDTTVLILGVLEWMSGSTDGETGHGCTRPFSKR
jgi:hypothetical protein